MFVEFVETRAGRSSFISMFISTDDTFNYNLKGFATFLAVLLMILQLYSCSPATHVRPSTAVVRWWLV